MKLCKIQLHIDLFPVYFYAMLSAFSLNFPSHLTQFGKIHFFSRVEQVLTYCETVMIPPDLKKCSAFKRRL